MTEAESHRIEQQRRTHAAWRKCVLDDTSRHYAELRANEGVWAEELAERALWDTTLEDGLTDCYVAK